MHLPSPFFTFPRCTILQPTCTKRTSGCCLWTFRTQHLCFSAVHVVCPLSTTTVVVQSSESWDTHWSHCRTAPPLLWWVHPCYGRNGRSLSGVPRITTYRAVSSSSCSFVRHTSAAILFEARCVGFGKLVWLPPTAQIEFHVFLEQRRKTTYKGGGSNCHVMVPRIVRWLHSIEGTR